MTASEACDLTARCLAAVYPTYQASTGEGIKQNILYARRNKERAPESRPRQGVTEAAASLGVNNEMARGGSQSDASASCASGEARCVRRWRICS
jgi:hypothetical protein